MKGKLSDTHHKYQINIPVFTGMQYEEFFFDYLLKSQQHEKIFHMSDICMRAPTHPRESFVE